MRRAAATGIVIAAVCFMTAWSPAQDKDGGLSPAYKKIEELTGARGKLHAREGAFRVSLDPARLKVTPGKARITTRRGTEAWASFRLMGSLAQAAGSVTMTQGQVNPVLDVALDNGLEVTAINHHFFRERPRLVSMNLRGFGGTEKIAGAFGKVFAKLKEPPPSQDGEIAMDPAKTSLNTASIEENMGHEGELEDGIFTVTIGRTTAIGGHELGAAMGVASRAAFAGSDRRAVVSGECALLEPEVQATIKALRAAGISIVALHNHMMQESPRIMFLQFRGTGPAAELARAVKVALDAQK